MQLLESFRLDDVKKQHEAEIEKMKKDLERKNSKNKTEDGEDSKEEEPVEEKML